MVKIRVINTNLCIIAETFWGEASQYGDLRSRAETVAGCCRPYISNFL